MQIGFGQVSPSASSTRDLGTRLSIENNDQPKHLQISLFINTSELYILYTVVHLKSARFTTTILFTDNSEIERVPKRNE